MSCVYPATPLTPNPATPPPPPPGANVALIFSGRAVKLFSQMRADLPPDVDGWGLSLKGLMGMVVIGGLLIIAIYYWLNRAVVPKIPKRESKKKKKGPKMSVGESFTFLANSSYIRDMATLVVAYGISINLVEVTWKSKIKAQFPNPNDYSSFMGDFSTATGAVTFTMMILSRYIFRYFGWGVAALITPTVSRRCLVFQTGGPGRLLPAHHS